MSREKSVEPVAKPKKITLQYLFKYDLPIWVVNRGSKGEAGVLVLQLGDKNNWKGIPIPPGSDPVCVSDMAPMETLRGCYDLHRAIDSEALELLDPDKAEEYYEQRTDRKQVVQDKIKKYLYKSKENVPDPTPIKFGDDDMDGGHFKKFREDGLPEGTKQRREKFVQAGPKPKIGDLCQKAQFDAISERDMFEQLLELSSSLTPVDLDHIEKNGKFDSVKRWASDQLKEKK